jgi:pyridoxal phosphate enzyme (YggS family)
MAIADCLQATKNRIAAACVATGRVPEAVRLLVVSKTFPGSAVREAFAAGARAFGENYVQEGLAKVEELADLRGQIEWHLIGPLQSNKTRPVAEQFDWVHSVDRLKVAQRLSEQRPAALPPLNVCLQVNVAGEGRKAGVSPIEVATLAGEVAQLPRLKLRGLMCMLPYAATAAEQAEGFGALRRLFDSINRTGMGLDTLSMGMSADLEAAVEQGSTLLRIGTALFGERG